MPRNLAAVHEKGPPVNNARRTGLSLTRWQHSGERINRFGYPALTMFLFGDVSGMAAQAPCRIMLRQSDRITSSDH